MVCYGGPPHGADVCSSVEGLEIGGRLPASRRRPRRIYVKPEQSSVRHSKLLILLFVFVVQLFVVTATSVARTISWDGYRWDVRKQGLTEPGPNLWSDSRANAHVNGKTGAMVLCYTKDSLGRWTSTELDNQRHLGYGLYRWDATTNMAGADNNEVLGLFTYDDYTPPSYNEIDIEYSHWGDATNPLGDLTVWISQNTGSSNEAVFGYRPTPKGTVDQFDWAPGKIVYAIKDARSGATMKSWTTTRGIPVPHTEVPVMNWWRYNNAPATGKLGNCVQLHDFTFTPHK